MNANGGIELSEGNPILINAEGKEQTVGLDTIARVNAENKDFREKNTALTTSLKAFEGLAPDKVKDAIAALETVSKLDTKKLIDAGEVDRVRAEISKGYQTQIDEGKALNDKLVAQLNGLRLESAFSASKFVTDNVAVPTPMLRATFDQHFKYENDALVAYDANGQKLFSKKRMGELANFDEAIEQLIGASAFKDQILRAPNHKGTNNQGQGGLKPGARTMKRADFDSQLTPAQKAEFSALVRTGEAQLID